MTPIFQFVKLSFMICSVLQLVNAEPESVLRGKYDGYGEDWIFMPDGNEQPQVAILKDFQNESRAILDEAISYILYTRYKAVF